LNRPARRSTARSVLRRHRHPALRQDVPAGGPGSRRFPQLPLAGRSHSPTPRCLLHRQHNRVKSASTRLDLFEGRREKNQPPSEADRAGSSAFVAPPASRTAQPSLQHRSRSSMWEMGLRSQHLPGCSRLMAWRKKADRCTGCHRPALKRLRRMRQGLAGSPARSSAIRAHQEGILPRPAAPAIPQDFPCWPPLSTPWALWRSAGRQRAGRHRSDLAPRSPGPRPSVDGFAPFSSLEESSKGLTPSSLSPNDRSTPRAAVEQTVGSARDVDQRACFVACNRRAAVGPVNASSVP